MPPPSAVVAPGPWVTGAPATVSWERSARFAGAVGETRPEFLSGDVCPPTIPVVLTWAVQNRALDGHLPEDALGLHGFHAFSFLRSIEPDEQLLPRARLESISTRRTGTVVTARSELHDGARLVCSQLFGVFVVGRSLGDAGPRDPSLNERGPTMPRGEVSGLGTRADVICREQIEAYAEASGDDYAIHTDHDYAVAMGLDGVVAHGMCTLAVAARAVRDVCTEHGAGELTHLSTRFTAPVLPGDRLLTSVGAVTTRTGLAGHFTCRTSSRDVLTSSAFATRRAVAGGPVSPRPPPDPRRPGPLSGAC